MSRYAIWIRVGILPVPVVINFLFSIGVHGDVPPRDEVVYRTCTPSQDSGIFIAECSPLECQASVSTVA
jgi:hypothetical protein